jgi:hypothetical protein
MDGWGEWIGDKMIKGEGEKRCWGFAAVRLMLITGEEE